MPSEVNTPNLSGHVSRERKIGDKVKRQTLRHGGNLSADEQEIRQKIKKGKKIRWCH